MDIAASAWPRASCVLCCWAFPHSTGLTEPTLHSAFPFCIAAHLINITLDTRPAHTQKSSTLWKAGFTQPSGARGGGRNITRHVDSRMRHCCSDSDRDVLQLNETAIQERSQQESRTHRLWIQLPPRPPKGRGIPRTVAKGEAATASPRAPSPGGISGQRVPGAPKWNYIESDLLHDAIEKWHCGDPEMTVK